MIPVIINNVAKEVIQSFFLQTNTLSQGVNPGQDFQWHAEAKGGKPPYAISWDWGDGKVDLLSIDQTGAFSNRHSYAKAGIYRIVIKGADGLNNKAYLETIAIVNGQLASTNKFAQILKDSGLLLMLWPLYLLIILMIVSFWLGERYEKRHLQEQWGVV